jgi:carboxyl-terminal processing protease
VAALAVVALIVAISGGFGDSDLTSQASEAIRDDYYKPVKDSVLDKASVDGIISELRKRYDDRFSHYLDPRELRQFDLAASGRFSGVGLTVTGVRRGLRVASVLPGTPAQRARIEEGDLITAVDGRSLVGVAPEVSTARIKGPAGTPVELRVVSASGGGTRDVHLKRASVELPVAPGEIRRAGTSKAAYVRYASFRSGAHGDLRSTLERLYRRGAEGLVLDLRGNGGGLLNEAVLSASVFLPKGELVVSTDSRTMGHRDYEATGDPLPQHPTVVLINRDTASAAEILASALRDHHLATIVGTRSFGKGTFQEVIHLAAGGALDLTVGEYFTANGTSLAGKGIKPDVRALDDPQTPRDEGLRRALAVLAEKMAVENR